MKERSFDEMIACFNRRVSEMDIAQDYKMELLGMVTALGYKHEKSSQPEIIRCKECKHFEYDHPYIIRGMPVFAHEVCNAWGGGCKTDENGYCFMAERRTDEAG